MGALMSRLIGLVKVAINSGGAWTQFQKQVLTMLPHDGRLKNLSLLPTCGTQFYSFDESWRKLYAENFTPDEKRSIIGALTQAVH